VELPPPVAVDEASGEFETSEAGSHIAAEAAPEVEYILPVTEVPGEAWTPESAPVDAYEAQENPVPQESVSEVFVHEATPSSPGLYQQESVEEDRHVREDVVPHEQADGGSVGGAPSAASVPAASATPSSASIQTGSRGRGGVEPSSSVGSVENIRREVRHPEIVRQSSALHENEMNTRKKESVQEQMKFEPVSRGRFEKTDPTIVDGEDLDVPTFLRKRKET
jgi:hypothetical protein